MEENKEKDKADSALAPAFEVCGVLVLAAALLWRLARRCDSDVMCMIAGGVAAVSALWLAVAGVKAFSRGEVSGLPREVLRYAGLFIAALVMAVVILFKLF